ncbi:hypothetical protein GE09DRAFT_788620 [Coniochaeta sp. 2T2.1]|nr:hypothetical protein GE09DRAFT_788620 [Coniochaeta sp. 2T2.1]
MKWQTLTLTLLASGALSSPIAALSKNDIYTLRVSSKSAPEIDGRPLTLSPTGQIGVYPQSPAIQFYTVPSTSGRTVELHKFPTVSNSDQVLAFVGANDLLDFSIADPDAAPPAGKTCDYKSFSLESRPGVVGRPANVVGYKGAKGGNWVAFKKGDKEGWSINWRGADAVTIARRSYMIVDVVYEPVGAEAGPIVGSS